MMNKEIAIIIPAYNAYQTIQETLQSINIQTFREKTRIYLIDDASIKNYNYLIKLFPNLDIIITRLKENRGPGFARNVGLKQVKKDGIENIIFVDADDLFFTIDAIERLYQIKKEYKADWVVGNFIQEEKVNNSLLIDYDVWLFGKIYSLDIINKNNITFPETKFCEDVAFNIYYKTCCSSIYSLEGAPLYYWKNNLNSITRNHKNSFKINSDIMIDSLIEVYSKMLLNSNISKEDYAKSALNRLLRFYGFIYSAEYEDKKYELKISSIKKLFNLCFVQIKEFWTEELKSILYNEMDFKFYPKTSFEDFLQVIIN